MNHLPPAAPVDFIASAVILGFVVLGCICKLSGELARLFAIGVPFVVSLLLYPGAAEWLEANTRLEAQAAAFTAYSVLLFVLLVVCRLLRPLIKRGTEVALPATADRILGGVAGLCGGIAVAGMFFVIMNLATGREIQRMFVEESVFGSITRNCMPELERAASAVHPRLVGDTTDKKPENSRNGN